MALVQGQMNQNILNGENSCHHEIIFLSYIIVVRKILYDGMKI